jgi:hypothetical protein
MADFTIITNATGETYQPDILSYTTVYRRKAISTIGVLSASGYSNELQIVAVNNMNIAVYRESGILIEEKEGLIIYPEDVDPGTIKSAQTIQVGEQPTELVTNVASAAGTNGEVVSYKWQANAFPNTAVPFDYIYEATGETYQPPILYSDKWYRRVAYDISGLTNVTSSLKITVLSGATEILQYGTLLPGAIADNQTINLGDTPALLTSVSAATNLTNLDTITYIWYESTDSGMSFSQGGTNITYQPIAPIYSTWFKRRAIQSTYLEAYTNVIKVTVMDGGNEVLDPNIVIIIEP